MMVGAHNPAKGVDKEALGNPFRHWSLFVIGNWSFPRSFANDPG
jgi:hypothetical protein